MIVFTDSWCQVIADFDATLTKFWVNGTRGQSMFPELFFCPLILVTYDAKKEKKICHQDFFAMYYI